MMSQRRVMEQQIWIIDFYIAIINYQTMSCSEQIVKKIYGGRLIIKDNHKYVHHLFTLFQDRQTKEQYFLRTADLPAFLHISQGIADLAIKKYQNLLAPLKIVFVDKNFQQCTYLLRAQQNMKLLTNFLSVKGQCSEAIQIQFFRKFVLFLLNSYQIIQNGFLPLFGINQIGITDSNEFTLCDPALYFRKDEPTITNQTFGLWIKKLLKQFLSLSLNQQQYQEIIRQKYQANFNLIWPLINYLISGAATLEGSQAKIIPFLNRKSEDTTTISSSFNESHDTFERGEKNLQSKNKIGFNKVGKLTKMIIIFIVLGVIAGVSYFLLQFFNRKILCEQGFYLSNLNQCLGCSDGCLRCQDSQPSRCMKCSINMYLVLDEQQAKQGFCLKQCKGKLISMDVCVKQRNIYEQIQKNQNIESNNSLLGKVK